MWHQVGLSLFNYQDDARSNKHKLLGLFDILSNTLTMLWTAVAQWLRGCATNRKVVGSIPDSVTGNFHWHKILPIALWPWGRLSLWQKWVPGVFPGGKGGRCVRLTILPTSCAVVTKSGNLNFLEPSGPLRACNGTDLPLPYIDYVTQQMNETGVIAIGKVVVSRKRRNQTKRGVWKGECENVKKGNMKHVKWKEKVKILRNTLKERRHGKRVQNRRKNINGNKK